MGRLRGHRNSSRLRLVSLVHRRLVLEMRVKTSSIALSGVSCIARGPQVMFRDAWPMNSDNAAKNEQYLATDSQQTSRKIGFEQLGFHGSQTNTDKLHLI
jgi:hypothetical protein